MMKWHRFELQIDQYQLKLFLSDLLPWEVWHSTNHSNDKTKNNWFSPWAQDLKVVQPWLKTALLKSWQAELPIITNFFQGSANASASEEYLVLPVTWEGQYRYHLLVNRRRHELYALTLNCSQEALLANIDHDDVEVDLVALLAAFKVAQQANHWAEIALAQTTVPLADSSAFQLQYPQAQALTQQLAAKIKQQMKLYRPSRIERVMNWSLLLVSSYSALRVHVLKFLSLLPCLGHDQRGVLVKNHFQEALRRIQQQAKADAKALPAWMHWPLMLSVWIVPLIPASLLARILRWSVSMAAGQLIAGKNLVDAAGAMEQLNLTGRGATLDQLGELVLGEREAQDYLERVLSLISGMDGVYRRGERNGAGILKAHVSIKVSALAVHLDPLAPDDALKKLRSPLEQILLAAKAHQVFINVDAEHYHLRDLIWSCYSKILSDCAALSDFFDTGIVVQAYLKDAPIHLNQILAFLTVHRRPMPLRLVKGAYWDGETAQAQAQGIPAHQFQHKDETDLCFRTLALQLLQHPYAQLTMGSHNLLDHAWAKSMRDLYFPKAPVIEHQCLHQTFESLSWSMAKLGMPVRNYLPVGDLLIGMAYLVRRIMENSSQVGVLHAMRTQVHQPLDRTPWNEYQRKKSREQFISPASAPADLIKEFSAFQNVPSFESYHPESRQGLIQAVAALSTNPWPRDWQADPVILPASWPRLPVPAPELLRTHWGTVMSSSIQWEAAPGVKELRDLKTAGLTCWLKIAQALYALRPTMAALIGLEGQKQIKEAIADVDETIDFINYYARQSLRYECEQALGHVLVIAPWNFPMAIALGMSIAPLMAGSRVILKCSERTPAVTKVLFELIYAAGVDRSQLQLAVGRGSTLGALLTEMPFDGFYFTGSLQVGRKLYYQQMLKNPKARVVAELGGKNAIIVGASADLDEALSGILYSAFAHAGQKCSACSRLIIHQSLIEKLMERLAAAISSLQRGEWSRFETFLTPVIDQSEQQRFVQLHPQLLQEAKEYGGKVWYGEDSSTDVVVIELPTQRFINADSFAAKELFLPILHVTSFNQFEEALWLQGQSAFALTTGLYSQSIEEMEYFTEHARAGNVYLNRTCTGARVAIEPFGGFASSGTGPKAGGPYYLESLYQFKAPQAKNITESTCAFPYWKKIFNAFPQLAQLSVPWSDYEAHWVKLLTDSSSLLIQSNRYIPTQRSQANFYQSKKILFWLEFTPSPVTLVAMIYSALLKGHPIILVPREQQAFYDELFQVLDHLTGHHVQWVYYRDRQEAFEQLRQWHGVQELELVITNMVLPENFQESSGWKQLMTELLHLSGFVKVCHEVQLEQRSLAPDWWIQFLQLERSIAHHTMRHGANLE